MRRFMLLALIYLVVMHTGLFYYWSVLYQVQSFQETSVMVLVWMGVIMIPSAFFAHLDHIDKNRNPEPVHV